MASDSETADFLESPFYFFYSNELLSNCIDDVVGLVFIFSQLLLGGVKLELEQILIISF